MKRNSLLMVCLLVLLPFLAACGTNSSDNKTEVCIFVIFCQEKPEAAPQATAVAIRATQTEATAVALQATQTAIATGPNSSPTTLSTSGCPSPSTIATDMHLDAGTSVTPIEVCGFAIGFSNSAICPNLYHANIQYSNATGILYVMPCTGQLIGPIAAATLRLGDFYGPIDPFGVPFKPCDAAKKSLISKMPVYVTAPSNISSCADVRITVVH